MSGLSQTEMWKIGQRIAEKRCVLGFSQEEFAEKVGLSRAAVGKIERGETAPKDDTLLSLCHTLNTTPNDILLESRPLQEELDTEMLAMAEMVKTFSLEQKRQFYMTMNLVSSGIINTSSGFLKNGN